MRFILISALATFIYLANSIAEEYVRDTVDIDFSKRVEVVKNGDHYKLQECMKERCRPLTVRPSLSLTEATAISSEHQKNQDALYGVGTSQFFYDLSKNLADESNSQTKMVIGKVVDGSEIRTALYHLRRMESIESIISNRLKELRLKESANSYILRKACNEAQCRPFNGVAQDFDEVLQQIHVILRRKHGL